jgi:hypothetical protein
VRTAVVTVGADGSLLSLPEKAGGSDMRSLVLKAVRGLVWWMVERFRALIHVAPRFAARYDARAWAETDGIIGVAQIN